MIPSLSLSKKTDHKDHHDEADDANQKVSLRIKIEQGDNISDALKDAVKKAGEEVILNVTTGDTIQFIKKLLNDEHDLEYKNLTMYAGGKVLMDPYSLADIEEINSDHAEVKLVVE